MKIKLLLISIFTSWAFTLSAQEEREYIPFVRDCEFGYYSYEWEEVTGFIHYWIEGEFTISGKSYKGYYSDINGKKELLGYVREEDRKVYFREVDNSWPWIEWLWYDFTLKKGDKFMVEEGSPLQWDGQNIEGVTVHETWPLDIAHQSRKCIDFNYGLCYWVEGMGDLYCLPFETFGEQPTCICGYKLFYIKENGEFVYYDMRHQVGDYVTNTPVEDSYLSVNETKASALHIAYHPEQIVVTLPSCGYRLAEVMDTTGRVAWCEYLDGEADEVVIPTAHLSQGVYIVALTSQNGERITCKVVK